MMYNPKRTRNLYSPNAEKPFKLSRSKIDLFLRCPRCFYLDRRLGVAAPPGFPFNLNSAVDALLKKEFDVHRVSSTKHPLMESYGVDAVPFAHKKMDEWRENFKGVTFLHEPTNFLVTGAVDDLWINTQDEVIVVDYKATSKNGAVNIDAPWQIGYKRQMEVYQWLLRQNGFIVSNLGYFVYCNGKTDRAAFDGKLEFDVVLLPYEGDDGWVSDALLEAKNCLDGDEIPDSSTTCEFCAYRVAAKEAEKQ
jgi:CRISPR/Cas system-associated exonuclease Cas4 (RecB family)